MQITYDKQQFPEIIIKNDVYRKICAYTDLCNYEISALGTVHVTENSILIDDIFLFEQEVTSSSTILSSKDISKFMCEYITQGKSPSDLKFWWHSHANMNVFWSGTDIHTINTLSSDWMISMVSNKNNDLKLRVDIFTPIRIESDNVRPVIEYDKSFNDLIKKEIDSKVKPTAFTQLKHMSSPPQKTSDYTQPKTEVFETRYKLSYDYESPAPKATTPKKEKIGFWEFLFPKAFSKKNDLKEPEK